MADELLLQPRKPLEILDVDGFKKDPFNVTIILHEEDHTIGNSLKEVLYKMDEVEFCGYNVPHPLEDRIMVRVQTKNGVNALEVTIKALENLEKIFATIRNKFQAAAFSTSA